MKNLFYLWSKESIHEEQCTNEEWRRKKNKEIIFWKENKDEASEKKLVFIDATCDQN